MDKKPFFVFDLQSFDQEQVEHLSRFQKEGFDIERVLEAASSMKFVKAAAAYLKEQLDKPADEFVRFFGKHIYEGMLTKAVVDQLRPAIQSALDEVIRDRIQDRLNVAFTADKRSTQAEPTLEVASEEPVIVTTEEELQAFYIVRAIAAKEIGIERVTLRDSKSYCAVFIDDNNRKPLCRFYFNAKKAKAVGFLDSSKNENRFSIERVEQIYDFSEQILSTAAHYR